MLGAGIAHRRAAGLPARPRPAHAAGMAATLRRPLPLVRLRPPRQPRAVPGVRGGGNFKLGHYLRLPTGIFCKPGVKANVLFFDRKPPQA